MSWRRSENRRKHLIKTYNKTKYHYGRGVWYDEDNNRYYRYTMSNGKPCGKVRFYKNYSNRLIKRHKLNERLNGRNFKKEFDLWWTIL